MMSEGSVTVVLRTEYCQRIQVFGTDRGEMACRVRVLMGRLV
jgi:hypothetical protein